MSYFLLYYWDTGLQLHLARGKKHRK